LRILIAAGREPWPLNSGGSLRLFNFLKGLTANAAVTLVLPAAPRYAEHLPGGVRFVNAADSAEPFASAAQERVPWITRAVRRHFGYSSALWRWLSVHARPADYDVALLFGAVTGQYIDAARIPVVWDAVDELVLYTVRDAAQRKIGRWRRSARAAALYVLFERHVAGRARATVFASTVDASYARRWIGQGRVFAISNGVDLDYFHGPARAPQPGTVAFVGSLCFPPNVEAAVRFATRIWPRVRAGNPYRRLLIVGRQPVAAVQELAHVPGVSLHGDVPDVRSYLSRAAVVVVPTRLGGGVKNKVLEACALRRPVVVSPRALGGLSARPGREVYCADRDDNWVRAVVALLDDPGAADRIGQRGYEWVRRAHDWSQLTGRLAGLLAKAAGVHNQWAPRVAVCRERAREMEMLPCRPRLSVRRSCVPAVC
jgi:glycosyltransferase involved in cell wall biosynthesis